MLDQAKENMDRGLECFESRNYKVALEFFMQAEEGLRQNRENFSLGELYLSMAQCYGHQGELEGAIVCYTQALEIYESNQSFDHTNLRKFRCHFSLGILFCKSDEFVLALLHFEKAEKLNMGGEHSYETRYHLGGCHQRLGKLQEAWKNFAEALVLGINAFGAFDLKLVKTYAKLGEISIESNRFDHALGYWTKALKITREQSREENEKLAQLYKNMGICNTELQQYEKAMKHYHLALDISQKLLKQEDHFLASLYDNMGICLQMQKKYDDSLEHYFRAFEIRNRIYGIQHPKTIQSVLNIGRCYFSKEEIEEALKHYELVCGLSEGNSSQLETEKITSLEGIHMCYEKLGDKEKADEYLKELGILCGKIAKQSGRKKKGWSH